MSLPKRDNRLAARRTKRLGRFARLYDRRLPTIRSRDAGTVKSIVAACFALLDRLGFPWLSLGLLRCDPVYYLLLDRSDGFDESPNIGLSRTFHTSRF